MEINTVFDLSARQLFYHLKQKFSSHLALKNFSAQHPCVFVMSTGRVGTKTLSALFRLAKNTYAYHEPRPKLYGLSKLAYKHSESWLESREVWQEAFTAVRADLLNFSLVSQKGYIETSPQVTFLSPIILASIPSVRFIHLVRNPRFVVRSGMRRKWYEGHPADHTRIIPHLESEAGQKWKTYTAFQKNIWLWKETNRWIVEFLSTVPDKQQLTLHSEDIFAAKKESIDKLFNFVSAPTPSSKKVLGILNKVLNAQKNGHFPEPNQWNEEMEIELRKNAGQTAKYLGYNLEKN